jgi:hypothetical protein
MIPYPSETPVRLTITGLTLLVNDADPWIGAKKQPLVICSLPDEVFGRDRMEFPGETTNV